ncbi:unnamed protein product [Prunus armeniaca]|uniref:Precursor of CEP14 n=2 Tax=Prunus TaxID=3754 RepID=A0A6J5UIC0_PRUAR|nr:PREDICTED: uncharacterized protein LOC103324892 [Prunus mume]KAH0985511.1 hypothetical protein GBA52_012688 [Prunus armeniaca]CAB4276290.1 unnamed protein product [Prunus armeniaca]CAB4306678.1 unnamed protein product [Prunus armeniaca]
MPRLSALAIIFLVVLASFAAASESRKLLDMKKQDGDGQYRKRVASLFLGALPKGTVPASTPSKKGHAVVINEKLIARHLSSNDRILAQAVPSPGVGH